MKTPATWECSYCEEKGLNVKRNCGWEQPGICKKCGEVPFEDVYTEPESSKFRCSKCAGPVNFGTNAEFMLGKSYRTPGCPKSMITERANFLFMLVDWSESTGKLPTAQTLLDEGLLYLEIRNFCVTEKTFAVEELTPKES